MKTKDVTSGVDWGPADDENLPLTSCVCGAEWRTWDGPILSIYPEDPTECPRCGRKFYFYNAIHVIEIQS